jgi:hypothetical protein
VLCLQAKVPLTHQYANFLIVHALHLSSCPLVRHSFSSSRSKLHAQALAINNHSIVEQRLTLALGMMTAMQGSDAADTLITDAIQLASNVRAEHLGQQCACYRKETTPCAKQGVKISNAMHANRPKLAFSGKGGDELLSVNSSGGGG